MKKNFLLIVLLLLVFAFDADAQLNYLLSATSRPYVAVTGGISPPLIMSAPTNANPPWTLSDEGFAHVPIGFTFNYDGKNCDSVTICANGFITMGDTITTRVRPLSLYENRLATGSFGFLDAHVKPVIAPFWDDLDLVDVNNLVYKTIGHSPFRVFTVEWKKTKWTFESTDAALSMEVKLYETTNVIEFHYKDEGGLPFVARAFASIGISSSYDYRDFISLQNSSANPSISLLRANDSITVKPANNQVYRFTPALIKTPAPFQHAIAYTNKKASFKLTSGGPGFYEYAVTRSSIPPASGMGSFGPNISVSSLAPATTYYAYARSNFFGLFRSQWVCDSFTTAVNPVSAPYHISGDPSMYPYVPADIRTHDLYDTAAGHYPHTDVPWNVVTDLPNVGDTSIWALTALNFSNANEWLFTPGLKLNSGKVYQLKFGYLSFASQSPGAISSIEVKYGEATGATAMTSGMLFKRDDIITDFNEDGWIDFEDTTIEIRPTHTGVYYFGFHNLTLFDISGPVPIIGNISIEEKSTLRPTAFALTGKTNSDDNVLNWSNNKAAGNTEVQRSSDGINFTTIGLMPSTRERRQPIRFLKSFGETREKEASAKGKDVTTLSKSRFEVEFKEHRNNSKNKKDSYDFTDHNAKGLNFYRLKKTGKKGKITYSNVVTLKNDQHLVSINVYPNPVKDILDIRLTGGGNNEITFLITDVSGKTVNTKTIKEVKRGGLLQLDISQIVPGAYILKAVCKDGCENVVTKFIKQ